MDLDRVLAHRAAVEDRSATRRDVTRFGPLLRNEDFPRSHAHQFLRVGALPAEVRAAELVAAVADLDPPHVQVRDEPTGARLQAGFVALGFQTSVDLCLVQRRPPDVELPGHARLASFEEVRPLQIEIARRLPYGDDPETVQQLVDRVTAIRPPVRLRHLVADLDRRPMSVGQLIDGAAPGVAQIEEVDTLEEARGRGLARSVVLTAARQARSDGADLVFLIADRDDWPQHLYRRLGFDDVGRSYGFKRSG